MPKHKTSKSSKPKGEESSKRKSSKHNDDSKRHKHHKHSKSSKTEDQVEREPLSLYCAVYTPRSGNYYHWAFAIYHPEFNPGWIIFEVTQQVDDGPFTAVVRETDPRASRRCLQPLTNLGQIHFDWVRPLHSAISDLPVPGEGASWNCQDYVMDIWDTVLSLGAIDEYEWTQGRNGMMTYYGPIQDDEEDYEEEDLEEEDQEERQPLSAEFISDSGSD
ncbi:unnamed protein product [Clonostachys chloroleuca]|uniref:Uncharacterized protein n=1 Tax=Clonostachys chloroleuca TaxID=1926264 RepID=A0AA35M158_9HYPO|nr:unnamed protein product [Clonostachys chloroleuca]CAI6088597.1 unnamed protein product [Clonostachys chloroleuca]CAI6090544.1 unnamed protein product [Clonostachys chloroleuca]CAI6091460.1 unnamed protein product [Clonostachys chloroleuca]